MFFQIIAVIILAMFYGCYFIKMYSQKKKGIQTDHIGKNKVGIVKVIEMTMKVITIILPLVELISIGMETSMFPFVIRIAGAVSGFFGVIVFICSVITMRDSWRAGVSENEKTELITNGIYQVSRNPAFLGFDLVYIGMLLMFSNCILLAATIFAVIMLHLQIVNVEEDFLVTAFGEEYISYRNKVNCHLGRKMNTKSR